MLTLLVDRFNSQTNLVIKTNPKSGSSVALGIAMVAQVQSGVTKAAIYVCVTYEAARSMYCTINRIAMYSNVKVGLIISATDDANDCDIIVGTPKELAHFIDSISWTNTVGLLVFDDADVTATTKFVKEQICDRLPNATIIALSSVFNATTNRCIQNSEVFYLDSNKPLGKIMNAYVTCTEENKIAILLQVLTIFENNKANCLIFCKVSL